MTTNPYEPPANSEEPAQSGPVMNCPQCGGRMELGFFPSTGVYWRKRHEPVLAISSKDALPGTGRPFMIRAIKIGALRCHDCEVVVFRYGSRMLKV